MTECIEWWGTRDSKGYGVKKLGGKMHKAHRLIYKECFGPIPDGLWVLHQCDNPPCVNPEHLHLGTAADNVHEMIERRRRVISRPPERLSCPEGHEKERLPSGRLICKPCRSDATRRYRTRLNITKRKGVSPGETLASND